jgi:hypothetical protein
MPAEPVKLEIAFLPVINLRRYPDRRDVFSCAILPYRVLLNPPAEMVRMEWR